VVRSAVGLRPREQAFDGVLPERACRGLLATPQRRLLTSKWFWIAAAIAFAIAFRMLPGNITSLPCARRPAQCKNDSQERRILPPLPFIGQQIRVLAPVSALV
jgi:hypothetical protein